VRVKEVAMPNLRRRRRDPAVHGHLPPSLKEDDFDMDDATFKDLVLGALEPGCGQQILRADVTSVARAGWDGQRPPERWAAPGQGRG